MVLGPGGVRLPDALLQAKMREIGAAAKKTSSTAPSSSTKAPKTTARSTSGQTEAQRLARAQAAAAAQARTAANNAARQSAQTDLDRINAEITAAQARRATNQTSLDALKKLVGTGPGSHAAVRDNALAQLDRALKDKLAQITATFETSLADFRKNLRDNEETEHDATFANLSNRARERQDLVTQALSQGAGESDVLRAQLQALRNWSANQADVNRAFFDTRSSINAGITDLNNQTRTGMINEELATNAARASRWDDYYEATGKTYSDMANLDQQNYLLDAEIAANERLKEGPAGLLKWLDSGKDAADYKAPTSSRAAAAPPKYTSPYAALAAEMAGSTWKDPGISKQTQEFEGGRESTGTLNTTSLWNAQANTGLGAPPRKRPEGATLRRW